MEEQLQQRDNFERAKTSHGRVFRDGKPMPESAAQSSLRTGKMLFSRMNQRRGSYGQNGARNTGQRPKSSISGRPSLGSASRGKDGQATAQLITDLEDLVLNQRVPHFKSPATHDVRQMLGQGRPQRPQSVIHRHQQDFIKMIADQKYQGQAYGEAQDEGSTSIPEEGGNYINVNKLL